MSTITFIALLRGINVSGQNMIKMEALKSLFEELGLRGARTYLQSGNAVFDCPGGESADLQAKISSGIAERLGFRVPVIIRAADELSGVLAGNPFINDRKLDPAGLYVTFLQNAPEAGLASALTAPAGDQADEFIIRGREVYLSCSNGYGRTKLNNTFFEKKLKTIATTRNWKTVTALCEMCNI
jgi:uncharacterized protein (DUF1697 family)